MPYPSKRTPEVVEAVLRAVAEGVDADGRPRSLRAACGLAGVSRQAWATWEADDADLRERREVAAAKGQAILEGRALDPDVAAPVANVIRHRLSRLDTDAWGDVVVNVDGGRMSIADLMSRDDGAATP